MKIYLSGKISGLTEKEYIQNFEDAKWQVWKQVSDLYMKDVINPLELKPF